MKHIRTYICASLSLLFILVLAGCSADDANGDGASEVQVKMALKASLPNTGDYAVETLDCELIKWYRVVVTARGSKAIILSLDKTLTSSKELDPVDGLQLSPGNYDVYAFANIDFSYLDNLGIKKGGNIPANLSILRYNISGYFNATPDADNKLQGSLVSVDAFKAAGHYIPMTSTAPQQIEVTTRVNQTYNIEVRRLFAKLEFQFRNTTSNNLQVNGLSVSNLTANTENGCILLMNYEEPRNNISLPYVYNIATLSHSFASPSVVNSNAAKVSHSFYVLESAAPTQTNSFELAFNVTRKGESASGPIEDYMRYALTDPSTLTLIHRNDWIVIPVTFSEWQMKLEARSYPPIGGYPEAIVDETESSEFKVTFQSAGDFVIRPFIRKYYDGSDWFGIDEKTKIVGTPKIEVHDEGNLFFAKTPSLSSSGEILGNMRYLPGIVAYITISVDVIESESPLMTKTLKRKIYVTQK